jgi:hypothetical protein
MSSSIKMSTFNSIQRKVLLSTLIKKINICFKLKRNKSFEEDELNDA